MTYTVVFHVKMLQRYIHAADSRPHSKKIQGSKPDKIENWTLNQKLENIHFFSLQSLEKSNQITLQEGFIQLLQCH